MILNSKQKQQIILNFPELQGWVEQNQTNQMLEIILQSIEIKKGEKGDKGDKPIKGEDYFTPQELQQIKRVILQEATPIKGVHYFDGEKGDSYILTPNDKEEIATKIKVPTIEKIIEKIEVQKSIEVTPHDIVKKLNTLNNAIDVSVIKGGVGKKELLDGMARVDGRLKLIDQRWHGGGLSKVSHDTTLSGSGTPADPLSVISVGGVSSIIAGPGISLSPVGGTGDVTVTATGTGATWYQDEVPSGTKNGSNKTFTLAHSPTSVVFLYLNGQYLVSGTDYTRSTTTITMTVAPLSTDVLTANYL